MTAHVFDWQSISKTWGNVDIRDWLLISAITAMDDEFQETVVEASDKLTKVSFEFLINGESVDAEKLLTRLEQAIDHAAEYKARELFKEVRVPAVLQQMQDDAYRLAAAYRERATQLLNEAGTPEWAMPDWED